MNGLGNLSFGDFLADIHGVVTSPRKRFALIQERGAMWGSLFLQIAPAYFALSYLGGVYFDRDPILGYSFVVPAIGAGFLALVKMFFIHVIARLFEGNGRYMSATGKFRNLVVVFGYTGVPAILSLIIALILFLLIPEQVGSLFRDFRTVCISVMVALGVALFVWNLILMVLALRTVYPMRDIKIVIALILGPILAIAPAWGLMMVAGSTEVDAIYLKPILSERILRFIAAEPVLQEAGQAKMGIHLDLLAYRLKAPKRFEFAAFSPAKDAAERQGRKHSGVVFGRKVFSFSPKNQIVGRIIGLPGDQVELVQGKLHINGQSWIEPYITPEYRSNASLSLRILAAAEYLILPEDRRLLDSHREELVVSRDRISGRMIRNKWPLGWWWFRSTIFLEAHPE